MKTIQKLWSAFLSAASGKNSITISFLLLCIPSTTWGDTSLPVFQPEFVQKNESGPKYQVGDRIQLTVRLPMDLVQDLSSVSIRGADEKAPLEDSGWFLDPSPQVINGNLRFIVSPVQTGSRTLPSLLILKNESIPIGTTSSIPIEVDPLEAKPGQTPPLIDVQSVSIPFKLWLIVILTLLILGVGIGFVYRKWSSRKKAVSVPVTITPPPTPDHVIALRELSLLYEHYPFSKENLKPIGFGISQILKNYFSSRFSVDARESTTQEMLALLRRASLSDADLQKISNLFKILDLVKFTELIHHEHLQRADYIELRETARSFIEQWAAKELRP